MKVLVTGATGFVGSHLVEALAARGDTVLAMARRPDQHDALKKAGATPMPGSLENERSLVTALKDVDVVYHVAGATSARDEAAFFAINEGGTRRVLESIRQAAPGLRRVVYVSTQAALGPSPRDVALSESAECRPLTPYGRSKLAGELAVRGSDLPWSVIRPPAVYGPRDKEFLKLFRIAKRGIAPVFGAGTQQLSLVHVRDLVEAIVLAGTHDAALRQIFHAAHPETVLSRDVARAAGAALGGSPVLLPIPGAVAAAAAAVIGRVVSLAGQSTILSSERVAEFLAPSWLLDVAKADRLLGWRAKTPMVDGIRETGAWYREQKWV